MTELYKDNTFRAGDFPTVSKAYTVASGQNLVAGTVIGVVTASGKAVACDTAASDGSQNPVAVLPTAVDASAADSETHAYVSGHFRGEKLTYGGATTANDVRDALRPLGIYIS